MRRSSRKTGVPVWSPKFDQSQPEKTAGAATSGMFPVCSWQSRKNNHKGHQNYIAIMLIVNTNACQTLSFYGGLRGLPPTTSDARVMLGSEWQHRPQDSWPKQRTSKNKRTFCRTKSWHGSNMRVQHFETHSILLSYITHINHDQKPVELLP